MSIVLFTLVVAIIVGALYGMAKSRDIEVRVGCFCALLFNGWIFSAFLYLI